MSREELKRLIADDAYAASFQTMGQYRSALLKAIAGRSADRNRPTMAPGGCECAKCGAIFIGGVEHDLCGVCAADSAQDVARAPEGWKLVPIRPTKKMIDAAQGYVWVAEEDATEEGIWRNMIAATPPAPVCETCNGRGEVGGFQVTGFGQGGYDSQPCPDCAAHLKAIYEVLPGNGDIELKVGDTTAAVRDTKLLDWLKEETCDLRCINVPTGGDDCDVRWVVIRHYMSAPHEREIGRSHSDDPRDALLNAIDRANADKKD